MQFDVDRKHPTEVGDEAKICLNLMASDLRRHPTLVLALIGNTGTPDAMGTAVRTSEADASQRARNSRDYLVKDGEINPARVRIYIGEPKIDGPEDIDRIEAQMVAGTVVEGNVETILIPAGAVMKYKGLTTIQ